jgi:hypothetical protein
MNIQDVVKNFMGKKITKEGTSKFWGTDDLHEHCLEELKRMSTDEKIQFLIERGVIDGDLGGDPVNPFGEMKPEKQLLLLCQKFIRDNEIGCSESIYQSDRIILNSPNFIREICDLVGYHQFEEDEK